MTEPIRKFKINGMPKDSDYAKLPFGRQIEFRHILSEFKINSKSMHLSQKRQSYTKAIKEAIKLYDVDQFYCLFQCNSQVKDDTFEFFYTTKTPA